MKARLTGLLLGAGASYELGMPLVWELTAEIKNWLTREKLRELNKGWRVQGTGHPDIVIDDLASLLERNSLHYEAILGYLETQFRRSGPARQEYYGLYSWLVDLVYHLLYYRQVNNGSFLDRHLASYEGIRTLAEANHPLWVFSLNHDVLIEAIAARFAISLHSGFSPLSVTLPRRDAAGLKKGELRAEVLTQQDLEHGAMYFPSPPQPGIHLLKVHGALDVFTFNDGRDLLKLVPSEPGQAGIIDVLRAANEDLFFPLRAAPGGKAKATNEIAYADDQGEMQFLRRSLLAGAFKFDARGTQVLPQSLLKHFKQKLNLVSNLVCIGYSFGDQHINLVVREWLEFSPERHLKIVGPNAEDVPPSLLHLAPQVTVTKSSATEYLDEQAGIVRTRRERLENRLCSVLRSLSKEQAAKGLLEFKSREKERMSRDFIARLEKLPINRGQPSLSSVGNPMEVARRWVAEMRGSDEELLDRLLQHFEGSRDA